MLRAALKMLMGDRAKWVGLLFGITFTSFLVTFAASYFCGFMTRGFALITENPAADVWVMDPAVNSIEQTINMPASALSRVRSVEGVLYAVPLAIGIDGGTISKWPVPGRPSDRGRRCHALRYTRVKKRHSAHASRSGLRDCRSRWHQRQT
jgi:hypothetical protein